MKLLGHFLNAVVVKMEADRIRDILEASAPKKVTELRGLLGLTGYYRSFVSNFEEISAMFHAIMSVKESLKWIEEIREDFENLRKKLTTPKVLSFREFDPLFVVETDASSVVLRVVLGQQKEFGIKTYQR